MPYLVRGNAQQLASLFNTEWLFAPASTSAADIIEADLPRTFFLGSNEQAEHHIQHWRDAAQSKTYAQGDMSAANLFIFLNENHLFKKEDENYSDYQKNYINLSFAYVNEKKELCGFALFYRKDNPSQWLIATSRNTSLSPEVREVTLFSSFDLNPFIKQPSDEVSVEVVDRVHNPLIEQIESPFVKKLLEHSLHAENGEIDSKILRTTQLLRMIHLDDKDLLADPLVLERLNPQTLFAENPTLDLISHYYLKLSSKMLVDCLRENSGLRKEIEALTLTNNPDIDRCLLRMTICFYEQGVLNEYRELIQAELFKKTLAGSIWNEEQIQLVPFLLGKKYAPDLFQLILSKNAYYSAVTELVTLGLTQDIPEYFLKADKLRELEFIEKVKDTSLKQLCLIFWVKGTLSYAEYQTIIKASQTYPLLAETLIALDKTGEVSIADLKDWVLDPQKHLQQSIIHHFASDYPVNKATLNKFTVNELALLNQSFVILKGKKNVTPITYDVVARDNPQGQLLRLFLPSFTLMHNLSYRDNLIDLLYVGIQKGPVSMDKQISTLTDNRLKSAASKLRDRLICAKQMQKLGLTDDIISFAAEPQQEGAKKFRHVILKIEAECKTINARLDANADIKQRKAWQDAEIEYRQILYALAYKAIKEPSYQFEPVLEQAQNKILNIVDPEIKSWLQKTLILLANVFIFIVTGSYANRQKEARTGNFWFFNHTSSGEELRAVEQDIKEQIRGPK